MKSGRRERTVSSQIVSRRKPRVGFDGGQEVSLLQKMCGQENLGNSFC